MYRKTRLLFTFFLFLVPKEEDKGWRMRERERELGRRTVRRKPSVSFSSRSLNARGRRGTADTGIRVYQISVSDSIVISGISAWVLEREKDIWSEREKKREREEKKEEKK